MSNYLSRCVITLHTKVQLHETQPFAQSPHLERQNNIEAFIRKNSQRPITSPPRACTSPGRPTTVTTEGVTSR